MIKNKLSKRLIVLLFLFYPLSACYAESSVKIDLSAISQIESSGNPVSVGDNGLAFGMYQLHEGVIRDYNIYHGTEYIHADAFIPVIARQMADWYLHVRIPAMLRAYHLENNIENILTAWNMGILRVKQKKTAKNYVEKYKKLTGEL